MEAIVGWIGKIGGALIAFLGIVLGAYLKGRSSGKEEEQNEQNKKELEEQKNLINTNRSKAEIEEKLENDIRSIEEEKEQKKKSKTTKVTLGKWCFPLLFVIFISSQAACTSKEYIYVKPDLPKLQKFERPALHEVVLEHGMQLDNSTLWKIYDNQIELQAWGLKYETQVEAYNAYKEEYESDE